LFVAPTIGSRRQECLKPTLGHVLTKVGAWFVTVTGTMLPKNLNPMLDFGHGGNQNCKHLLDNPIWIAHLVIVKKICS
jgi:hypothetical protein